MDADTKFLLNEIHKSRTEILGRLDQIQPMVDAKILPIWKVLWKHDAFQNKLIGIAVVSGIVGSMLGQYFIKHF